MLTAHRMLIDTIITSLMFLPRSSPSCLQTTPALSSDQPGSAMSPHRLLLQNSTIPLVLLGPPTRRTSPVRQTEREADHSIIIVWTHSHCIEQLLYCLSYSASYVHFHIAVSC